jgi:hypothetical protein
MGRRREIDGGKTRAFYLGRWHMAALRRWGARRGIEGDSAALQAVLELVAKAEGVPPDALADPDAPELPA